MRCSRIALFIVMWFSSLPAFCQRDAKVKWDSAMYFWDHKNFHKALTYIDQFIALHPVASQGYIAKAQLLGNLQRFDQSNAVLSDLIAREPTLSGILQLRGMNHLFLKEYDSCINDFNRVLANHLGDDSVAYRARAYCYDQKGEHEKSKVDYDSADRYFKSDADYFRNRALNKYSLHDVVGAIRDLTLALRFRPQLYEAVRMRAALYFEIKDISNCFIDCNTILSRDKHDQLMLYLRGQCYMAQKEHKLAVNDFNACSEENPALESFWFVRGCANYYLAQDEKAISDLTRALKTEANKKEIYHMIGICKNNLKPGTGCDDIRMAIKLGNDQAAITLKGECN